MDEVEICIETNQAVFVSMCQKVYTDTQIHSHHTDTHTHTYT